MSKANPSSLNAPELLSPEQIELVRHHLEELVASTAFAGSKRTQDFLRLVVGHALEGDLDSLRERMIGAELFGRPISYDTGSDSVVRVRASEARKKLALYYGDKKGADLPVRVELPSGSYVPKFQFSRQEADPVPSIPTPVATDVFISPFEPTEVALPSPQVERDLSAPASTPIQRGTRYRIWAGIFALVVLTAGLGAYFVWFSNANAHRGIHSIAILPLENLSGDRGQEYFADGVTEELINNLGQVSTLRVISLTSSMSYKGTKKKLPEIAKELAVDGVVEGGVLRDGDQVRISAQLIDARTDRPIWAHTYIRDLTNVIAWQGEVAQAIAEEISTEVSPREQALLARKSSTDPEAQDLYLHGILLRNQSDCKNAVEDFKRAIAKSPNYAQAHSSLASCYGLMGESGQMPYEQAFALQKSEAMRAIQLDDSNSEAHAELANTAMTLDWNWPAAAAQFHRALELNPNSATSHQKYAFYLVRTGHLQEALTEVEKSVDLDPVSGSTFHSEGFIYYFSRQYDQALAVSKTVRGLKINLPDWNFLLGATYTEKGMYPEAIAAFRNTGGGPYARGHLGNTYARANRRDAALEVIAGLQEDVRATGVGRYEIALVYAGLGDKEKAFEWLENAYHAHDVGLVYLKIDPCLDPLRSDPRFADLLRRVGLAA